MRSASQDLLNISCVPRTMLSTVDTKISYVIPDIKEVACSGKQARKPLKHSIKCYIVQEKNTEAWSKELY